MNAPPCPLCGALMTDPRPDKLDQSGTSYLPAETWRCTSGKGRCSTGETLHTLPTGAPYQPREYP